MGQISSINFKKSIPINTEHNDRTLAPNYLIDKEKGAECNRNAEKARELKNQIINEAKETYQNKVKQKFQAKNFEWSAVVNIKPDTTMQDLENLAKHFNDKYGFQCYQIAIHRDEGHKNTQGEIEINQHAHMEFITLDKETGKQNFKMRDFSKQKMREIQTEVAEILQMERGKDKRLTGAKRIEPRKYAQLKEQEKANTKELKKTIKGKNKELLSQKAINERLEQERKAWLNENKALKEQNQELKYQQADYKELKALNKRQFETIEALNLEIQKLKDEKEKNEREKEVKIKAIESDLNNERIKNNELQAKINKNENKAISEDLNAIKNLQQENQELKTTIQEQKQEIQALTKIDNAYKTTSYEQKSEIAQTILNDYEKAKSNAINRATKKTGMFGNKTIIDYEQAFKSFVEYSDNEHKAIKKAVLNEPLDYYERENSLIKKITNFLSDTKKFAENTYKSIIKKKDEFINKLEKELNKTKKKLFETDKELKKYKEKYEFISELYNSKHDDLAIQEMNFEVAKQEKQDLSKLKLEDNFFKKEQINKKEKGPTRTF